MTACARARQHKGEDDETLDEDHRHSDLPRHIGLLEANDRERHNGVQAHARCQRKRSVADETHREAHESRAERRRSRCALERHTRSRENPRVHEDDVRHCEERRDSGKQLGSNVGSTLCELEERIHSLTFHLAVLCDLS